VGGGGGGGVRVKRQELASDGSGEAGIRELESQGGGKESKTRETGTVGPRSAFVDSQLVLPLNGGEPRVEARRGGGGHFGPAARQTVSGGSYPHQQEGRRWAPRGKRQCGSERCLRYSSTFGRRVSNSGIR